MACDPLCKRAKKKGQKVNMDKIYSRKRIKIPEFRAEENKILRKTLKTLLIVLIATIVIITILNSSTPIFEELCIDKAKSLATIISNEEATNVMKDYEYDDIIRTCRYY